VDGLSHREIADILGVPEGTVWSRLHAARRMLIQSMST
jgi:RNA polymerase sigma-70 factor (ECF subfamily)